VWDTAKATLRGEAIVLNAHIRKEGSTLGFHFRKLEKEVKSKVSRREEIENRNQHG
jgi:hypothetical protein